MKPKIYFACSGAKSMRAFQIAPIMATVMISSPSYADQYYGFVKVDCDKVVQTMTITMPRIKKGDDPEAMLARIRNGELKNMYDIPDLAKEPKTKVKCDLGNGQALSMIVWHDEAHMAHDNLILSVNERGIERIFFNMLLEPLISISSINPDDLEIKVCQYRPKNKSNQNECETEHFKNGIKIPN